jgi:hypothetical protein
MLVGTWNGITRQTFCITFAIIIAVFMLLAHLFYYHNIEVTPEDVDADGNCDPNQVKEQGGFAAFNWSEVCEIVGSHELLMLAFFYSMNSVCIVWTISTLNKQLKLVNSDAPNNFSVVYTVASLNVFLFGWVLQKFGFTVG